MLVNRFDVPREENRVAEECRGPKKRLGNTALDD